MKNKMNEDEEKSKRVKCILSHSNSSNSELQVICKERGCDKDQSGENLTPKKF